MMIPSRHRPTHLRLPGQASPPPQQENLHLAPPPHPNGDNDDDDGEGDGDGDGDGDSDGDDDGHRIEAESSVVSFKDMAGNYTKWDYMKNMISGNNIWYWYHSNINICHHKSWNVFYVRWTSITEERNTPSLLW